MRRMLATVPIGITLLLVTQFSPGFQSGFSDQGKTEYFGGVSAQSSSEREREARERSERTPDRIKDNRDGKTREIKALSRKDKENLNECVTLMIIGRSVKSGRTGFKSENKRLKIQGHHFKCKGMHYAKRLHKRIEMSGQLSRHLRARPDDQINYSFTLSDDGTIDNVQIKYGGGAFRNITRTVTTAGGLTATKGWKGAANLVIGTMVQRISRSVKLARTNRSRGRYEWGVSRFGTRNLAEFELAQNQNRPIYCKQRCADNRKCKAWTFTGGHRFRPKCTLHPVVNPARISREQRVSGIVTRR